MMPRFCSACKLQSSPGAEACVKCGKTFPRVSGAAEPKRPQIPEGRPTRAMGPRGRVDPRLAPSSSASQEVILAKTKRMRALAELNEDLPTQRLVKDDDPPTRAVGTARPAATSPGAKSPEAKSPGATTQSSPGVTTGPSPGPASSATTRRRFKAEDVRAFLCCEPFRPLPLVADHPVVTLGRSRGADLVLPHESVSRTHALVRVLGDAVTVEDRSTYGTHVNGKRVRESPVVVGDVIQVGPYLISVRDRPERSASEMGEEVTRPFRTLGATSEALHGKLERVSLAEVLQTIEFNEKTGTLRVFDDRGVESVLVVYEGAPVYAENEKLRDAEVVHHMLALKRGEFSFQTKIEAGEMSMQGETLTGILLDHSRRVDEAQ